MQTLFVGVVAVLCSLSLCGCSGSSFHGTLGGGSNDPKPDSGQPVVTGLSPASVVAGGPTLTITVSGNNFAQGDTVEWGATPLSSTFVSPTTMTAQVPNQLISYATSETIIVQTPVPYTLNFGTTFTVTAAPPPGNAGFNVSTVNVQANDMVWNPSSQQIYLSVAGTDTINPNTITALDPATGQLGVSVSAGSGAYRLGVSSDGSLLYAGINNDGSVQRFTLPGLGRDITIPLGTSVQPYYAADVEPAPGSPNTVAVSRATSPGNPGSVVIYDGSTPRPATVSSVPGPLEPLRSLAWNASGSNIYASFNDVASTDLLFVLSVNSSGVQLSQSDQLMTGDNAFTMGALHYSALTGYLYSDDGPVIDPSAGSVVNHLPLAAVGEGLYGPPVMALDDNLGIAWVIGQPVGNSGQQYVIEAFDLQTNALLHSIAIPNVVGTPIKLIRWGSNGLAFLTSGANGPQQGDGVYLISGNFVTNPSAQFRIASDQQN